MTDRLRVAHARIKHHLEQELIPFWLDRALDTEFGGYLTNFDRDGNALGTTEKYLVSQARMIWGFSALYQKYGRVEFSELAQQGVDFLTRHFWDAEQGGWIWKTDRAGNMLDAGKITYGQSFAIYALAQYSLATGDPRGQEHAEHTFDLLQKYAADTLYGGYLENMEPDWSPSGSGYEGGDRKSLDIHMHLLEAFTTLLQLTGKPLHRLKLEQLIRLILTRMYNPEVGCGRNQFNLAFHPVPAISIRRTWNDDRIAGETVQSPTDTTSYGHNVELSWLLNRAAETLSDPRRYESYTRALCDHAIRYGLDEELGGVYRDGPHTGAPLVRDKEWWQNCEVLVCFLDAFVLTGDDKYFEAFEKCWTFCDQNMINHQAGEWYQLVKASGHVLIGDMGNPWKVIYHTGRAMMECLIRLEKLYK